MTTVADQIAWEKKHAEISADKFYFKQDKLRDSDRGDEVDSVRSIMRQRLAEVGSALEHMSTRTAGVGGKYNAILRQVATFDGEPDFNVLAYLGVQTIFQKVARDKGNDWVRVGQTLGRKLEFEHKTAAFETEFPGYYYTVMQSFEQQQVSSYKHMRNTLAAKMEQFDFNWEDWDLVTRAQVANKILLVIVTLLSDVFFRSRRRENEKTITTIETTPLADDWLAEFEKERGYFNPLRMPMLIKPMEWMHTPSGVTGGYYTHRLQSPLIKAYSEQHKAFIAEHDYQQHLDAINKLQATKWEVNTWVLNVQKEMLAKKIACPGIPLRDRITVPDAPASIVGVDKKEMTPDQLNVLKSYKAEVKGAFRDDKARIGKLIQFKMAYDIGRQCKDMKFHFVYTADFRGRIYAATTGLSPQSNDTSKALLQFANGKPVTQSGLFWMAVHGANTYGNDKIPNDDRVNWIYDNEELYRRIVADPIGLRDEWKDADKPWQYLAFIHAWAACSYGANPTALSYIPIGLDGSCNGLQHYSAILRDSVGGRGVNLINSHIPSDIYQDVSDRLRRNLGALGNDPTAVLWLKTGLGRKLTKRPVMTLPYGSTRSSARTYIHEWAMEHRVYFPGMTEMAIWEASCWLTPHLWEAIGQTVIAARAAMDWIQQRATQVVRTDQDALTWLSPVGFPVYQPYMIQDTVQVSTRLAGGIRIRVNVSKDTEDVARSKQRSGIAPNFVHSLDSSHMVKVINATDFEDYAMIHDDFGTHACDTGKLWKVIREQFVEMYQEDVLKSWSDQQGKYYGDYPEKGDLNLNDVLTSEFFFG